jgi:flavodoxin
MRLTMKTLVAFYSLTGNTSLLVSKIAALLHADTDRILTETPYEGGWGYVKAAYHSLTGQKVAIKASGITPQEYDLVVVAGPVWTGRIAPPVRTYLERYRDQFKHIAFCVTQGGTSPGKAFQQMEAHCGTKPVETLSVQAKEVVGGRYDKAVRIFVKQLQQELARPQLDTAVAYTPQRSNLGG